MVKIFSLINPIFFALFVLVFLIEPIKSEEDSWVVSDIRISGLQRVSAGSVFAEMPIAIGDRVDTYALQVVAKTLFKTGQFDDIQIGKDGNILIISLVERPSISAIEIDGNKALKTEDLMKGLKGAGLSEGQVFKLSLIHI